MPCHCPDFTACRRKPAPSGCGSRCRHCRPLWYCKAAFLPWTCTWSSKMHPIWNQVQKPWNCPESPSVDLSEEWDGILGLGVLFTFSVFIQNHFGAIWVNPCGLGRTHVNLVVLWRYLKVLVYSWFLDPNHWCRIRCFFKTSLTSQALEVCSKHGGRCLGLLMLRSMMFFLGKTAGVVENTTHIPTSLSLILYWLVKEGTSLPINQRMWKWHLCFTWNRLRMTTLVLSPWLPGRPYNT